MDMMDEIWKTAFHHRNIIDTSEFCGCFYCGWIFKPKDIVEWVDDDRTALCPRCGIDAVLGDSCDAYIDTDFLYKMHQRWYDTSCTKIEWERNLDSTVLVKAEDREDCEGFGCDKQSRIIISGKLTDLDLCPYHAKQLAYKILNLLKKKDRPAPV